MAEVIGVTTGIVSLVSLSLTVSQVSYDYVQKVRGSSTAISRYLQEILALSSALLKVQETLALPGIASVVSSSSPTGGKGDDDKELLPKSLIAETHRELEAIRRKLQKRVDGGRAAGFSSKVHALTWPFQEKETLEIVEKLSRWNRTCDSIVSAYNLRLSNATLAVTQAQRDDSQRLQVLDWIYSSTTAVTNDEVYSNYCEDTCLWVLKDLDYTSWRGRRGGALFCTGNPGAGKTTLTSFLVNHLTSTASADTRVLYHYFVFSAEHDDHKGPAVVRHLLRQCLEYSDTIPPAILRLYEGAVQSKVEVTYNVWLETFCKLISTFSHVYIMLDGVDECHDRPGLGRFVRMARQTNANIYAAGRGPIDLPIRGSGDIEIRAPSSDLETYIRTTLEEDQELYDLLTDSLADEIVSTLVDYADGIFLLVKLALNGFSDLITVRQIRNALLRIPSSLTSAHQDTFDRIDFSGSAAKRDLALKALAWVLAARRPLTMTELLHALAFGPDDTEIDPENLTTPKRVIGSCLGFLEHREDNDLVQFTHATVREFLLEERSDIFDDHKLEVACICIRYLAQPAFELGPAQSSKELTSRLHEYPLLDYTASHWGSHAKDLQSELTVEIAKLTGNINLVANAAQVFHYRRRTKSQLAEVAFLELPRNFNKLHLLALWGLASIATLQAPTYAEITAPDSLGWTPLHWAAARGHADMIAFLLSRGAPIEAKDFRLWTPLFWAAFWSRDEAVRLLLDKGAQVNVKDKDGESPLHVAVSRGAPNVCRELLDSKADWTAVSTRGSSLLELGLGSSVPEMASMFLALKYPQPVKSDAGESVAETVLERAATKAAAGHNNSVFKATLQAETTASQRENWPRPLLPRLKEQLGSLRAIDPNRLTDIGSDVYFSFFASDLINQDDYAAAVLGYAILTGRKDMVKALIDTGIDLNVRWGAKYKRIEDIQYPVLLASFLGNAELINLLVGEGASVCVSDYEGRTPLHYAVILGHVEAAQALCSHPQLLDQVDKEGQSPLHLAWSKLLRSRSYAADSSPPPASSTEVQASLALAELLVQHGARVDLPDNFGRTPLHVAVRTGLVEPIQKLIQLKANPNHRASKAGDVWRPSWRRDSEPAEIDSDGNTPFTLACVENHLDLASVLHGAGALLPEDMDLRQPVTRAVADGNLTALQTLFSFGPAPRILGNGTPEEPLLINQATRSLSWIMKSHRPGDEDFLRPFTNPTEVSSPADAPERYCAVVKFLLDVGCDADAEDESSGTALLEALEQDFSEPIVKVLLQHGTNVHASRSDGTNALHVAAATGDLNYIETLLSLGVDVNKPSARGHTPVAAAAANGHEHAVKLLLDQPSIDQSVTSKQNWVQLAQCYNAIKSQNLESFRDSSTENLPLDLSDRRGQTLLHLAADSGVAEMVVTLLSRGVNTAAQDMRGDAPLHIAAGSKSPNVAIVEALTSHGVGFTSRNFGGERYSISRTPQDATALHLAAYVGNADIVQALLRHAVAELGEHKALGKTPPPVPDDARDDDDELVEKTAAAGAAAANRFPYLHGGERPFIDWTSDRCGRTALMCAVQSGDVDTVRCLLEMGAEVNASGGAGSWGFAALDLALPRDPVPSQGVSSLLSFDDDDNESDAGESDERASEGRESGVVTSVVAEEKEESEMVKLLKSYGAEVFDW